MDVEWLEIFVLFWILNQVLLDFTRVRNGTLLPLERDNVYQESIANHHPSRSSAVGVPLIVFQPFYCWTHFISFHFTNNTISLVCKKVSSLMAQTVLVESFHLSSLQGNEFSSVITQSVPLEWTHRELSFEWSHVHVSCQQFRIWKFSGFCQIHLRQWKDYGSVFLSGKFSPSSNGSFLFWQWKTPFWPI